MPRTKVGSRPSLGKHGAAPQSRRADRLASFLPMPRLAAAAQPRYGSPTEVLMANGTSEGGKGGLYALLVVIIVLLIAGFLYFSGGLGGSDDADLEIDVDVPEAPGNPGGN